MKTSRDFIPFRDFVSYGEDLNAGEQIHVNHTNCPAGEDHRRRLYIKRTEDDRNILAYCHNCSLSGNYRLDFGTVRSHKAKGTLTGSGTGSIDPTTLPRSYTLDQKKWDSKQRTWINRYGITTLEQKEYKIGADTYTGKVILPVYREGLLLGYQERYLGDDADEPKYKTNTTEKPLFWYSGDYKATLQSSICIVEDVLSGIKVARFMPSLALMGSNMSDKHLAFILRNNFDKFIVFLDDDNRQIKLNQLKIKAELAQFGDVKLITGVNKDPKACSNDELEELLL